MPQNKSKQRMIEVDADNSSSDEELHHANGMLSLDTHKPLQGANESAASENRQAGSPKAS